MRESRPDPREDEWVDDPYRWMRVTAAMVQEARREHYSLARVVITFDSEHRHDLLFLHRLVSRLCILRGKSKQKRTGDEDTVHEILSQAPSSGEGRRWELPRSLTDGVQVYLCEARLPHDLIPVGMRYDDWRRELTMLPCRAQPRRHGQIEMLRYRLKEIEATHDRWVRCVAKRGVPVTAALVQANNRLFEPGREPLPALVLITFDRDIPNLDDYLSELAQRVFRLKEEDPRDAEERYVAELTRDERAAMYRRRRLPEKFTGGPVVYAADLIICPWYLRDGCLRERLLPCIAEPGDEGAIEHLPHWDPQGAETSGALLDVLPAENPVDELPEVLPAEDAKPRPAAPPAGNSDAATGYSDRPLPVLRSGPVGRGPEPERRPRKKQTAAVEEPPEDQPEKPSPQRLLLVLGVGAAVSLLLLCGVGTLGAWWWLSTAAARPGRWVTLSNPRQQPRMGMVGRVTVDYSFAGGGPATGARYTLVIRSLRDGQTMNHLLQMPRPNGTIDVTFILRPAVGIQDGPYEMHVEAEFLDRPGVRTRISNTVTTP